MCRYARPTPTPPDLAGRKVGGQRARRSIGVINADRTTSTINIPEIDLDLDHLLTGHQTQLTVAAIEPTGSGRVTIGKQADAHGNHDVPSQWWSIGLDLSTAEPRAELEQTVIYAAAGQSHVVAATKTGHVIATNINQPIIQSRAIRFVAA